MGARIFTAKYRVVFRMLIILVCLSTVIICRSPRSATAQPLEIGVFYFPGWLTGSAFWKDLTGAPGSRSPGVAWPEREPLLGFNYPEEAVWVAEKEIEWAAIHGITFFAYDWYWYGTKPDTEHAQQAYLKAKNRSKLKFCLLWGNSNPVPATMKQFDDMVSYWLAIYFKEAGYYRIDGKPVMFIVSPDNLARQSMLLGETPQSLLARANAAAQAGGFAGIYFVATINDRPGDMLEKRLLGYGFNAYTGWNYALSKYGTQVVEYDTMVDTYLDFYRSAARTGRFLPYIVPASPGYDDRPWHGDRATVRTHASPEKFADMLTAARDLLNQPRSNPSILMIESWNEYAEGSVIAPTRKWGLKYLQTVKNVFFPAASPAVVKP